jgi:hypothetical protein
METSNHTDNNCALYSDVWILRDSYNILNEEYLNPVNGVITQWHIYTSIYAHKIPSIQGF